MDPEHKLHDFQSMLDTDLSLDSLNISEAKEVSVMVAGQVDSSKSTTIGVLVFNKLDDGMLFKEVDKYKHEKESRHTSSVSTHHMIKGNKIINLYNLCGHQKYLKHTLYGIGELIILVTVCYWLTSTEELPPWDLSIFIYSCI